MLGVIPGKVATEVFSGLSVIQKLPGILRGAFDGAEGRFDERIVIGGAGAGKQLGHAVIFTQPLDGLGFHLAATIIDDFGPLLLGQVQDVLICQAALQQAAGFLGGLVPGDAPLDDFAGPFIQQQVEEEILPPLAGHQVADVPAPPLIGPGQIFADRRLGVAVMGPTGTPRRHQVPLLEDAVNGGEGGLKQALIPRRHREDAMGQVHVFLTLGQRHNLIDLLGQNPMQRLFWAGDEIGQRLSLSGLLLPANDTPVFNGQKRTGPTRRNALLPGGLNHGEDFQFGLLF